MAKVDIYHYNSPTDVTSVTLSNCDSTSTDDYAVMIQQEIDAGKAPGFVSLVYRNGYLAHDEALGYSNIDHRKANYHRRISVSISKGIKNDLRSLLCSKQI